MTLVRWWFCCVFGLLPLLAQAQVYLDVGIVVFDEGLQAPVSSDGENVFPRIRRAEALYMPVQLRRMLEATGDWGAVRVLPDDSPLVDLTVHGRIVSATGQRLSLFLEARDASGRVWLAREYTQAASADTYPVSDGDEPFAGLYREVVDDLGRMLASLSVSDLEQLRLVASLRYAQGLAPEAFAGYLQGGGDAPWELLREPAADDPMLARVERVRQQEYLFVDVADEQYGELHDAMATTYNLWRQYRWEQATYRVQYEERVELREDNDRPGSYPSMLRDYNAYRAYRIQQQDLDELAGGFNNEIEPTVVQTRGRVFRLGGTLQARYDEWRRLMREIFRLETGLPPEAADAGRSAPGVE
ncbi:hypothetical protein E4634_19265 [Mangrovimicrobium sediminis]|uniref:Uncharacterized protein n=1 Tax=Mangrovimicrobium sediminis TaxID=2562682 RepID=A0A4Z0LVV1_9GAMM|nr:hypothetical protein [Haliea sp. SAOS-164]TGD71411.1 hypothetical protein E4634_19265 [Haliea sp. SAOS-164]